MKVDAQRVTSLEEQLMQLRSEVEAGAQQQEQVSREKAQLKDRLSRTQTKLKQAEKARWRATAAADDKASAAALGVGSSAAAADMLVKALYANEESSSSGSSTSQKEARSDVGGANSGAELTPLQKEMESNRKAVEKQRKQIKELEGKIRRRKGRLNRLSQLGAEAKGSTGGISLRDERSEDTDDNSSITSSENRTANWSDTDGGGSVTSAMSRNSVSVVTGNNRQIHAQPYSAILFSYLLRMALRSKQRRLSGQILLVPPRKSSELPQSSQRQNSRRRRNSRSWNFSRRPRQSR